MEFLLSHAGKIFWLKVALFAAILWLLEVRIPWPVAVVLGVLTVALYLVLRIAVLPVLRRQVADPKDVRGQGRVVEPLGPVGLIKVGGEYWKAESLEGDIGVDESVEVVGQEGLTLRVARSHREWDTSED